MWNAVAKSIGVAVVVMTLAATAGAQSAVTINGTAAPTTMSAVVSDQARVQLPAGIAFHVSSVERPVESDAVSIVLDHIVLATSTTRVRLSVQAVATSFTPPVAGATTWDAGDVSWTAAQWSNAAGAAGTLSPVTYSTIATCHADVSSCNTDGLYFRLASKPTVSRAGSHTLAIVWKLEAIDP